MNSDQQGPIAKIITLLIDPNIQKELQLAGPQLKRIKESIDPLKESFMPRMKQVQNLPDSEKAAARPALIRELIQAVDAILEKVMHGEQFVRFKQIRLQKEGVAAFMDQTVRDALGVTAGQAEKIKEILLRGTREITAAQRGTPGGRAQAIAEARAKTEDEIVSVLSGDQAVLWKEMKGTPFDFTGNAGSSGGTPSITSAQTSAIGLGTGPGSSGKAAGPGTSGPASGGPGATSPKENPFAAD